MNSIFKVFFLIMACVLCSCSNKTKDILGMKSQGPDSSTVSERPHLAIPPIMPKELPKPEVSKK